MTRIHATALMALGLVILPYTSAKIDKWTPEGFDWELPFVNESIPSCLSMKAHESPETSGNSAMSTDSADAAQVAFIAAFFGFAYRAASIAVAGISEEYNRKLQTTYQQGGPDI